MAGMLPAGDQMNEFMYIGRLLSEDSFQRKKHEIMLADLPAKVDMIETRNGELMIAEIKKSSKRIENGKLQLKYYLYLLYKKGYKIKGIEDVDLVFHAGTAFVDGDVFTNGGRVLGVTAIAKDLEDAVKKAYIDVERIDFEGKYYRSDIAKEAL